MPGWLAGGASIKIDFKRNYSLLNACKDMDVIIHASGMNASECSLSPVRALECNGLYTTRLAEAAAQSRVKKFIYLSTAHIYSRNMEGIIDENTSPKNFHPYASSHLAGERSVQHMISQQNIEGNILRVSNVFGYPANPENKECWRLVLNEFCRTTAESGVIEIKNGGSQFRDFVPVEFLIDTVKSIISSKSFRGHNDVINVGMGNSLSIKELAGIISERCYELFNFRPLIIGLNQGKEGVLELAPFKFLTLNNKLSSRQAKVSLVEHIDILLKYCMTNFNGQWKACKKKIS